jgi:hypothetical protein
MAYGGGGDYGAGQARKLEQERQNRIKAGMAAINSTFDGGTYGSNLVNDWDSYQALTGRKGTGMDKLRSLPLPGMQPTFYDKNGKPIDLSKESDAMIKGRIARGELFRETKQSGGYGEQFYKDRENAYLAYAMPRLAREHQSTSNNLTFALARQGLLHGSAQAEKQAALGRELSDKQREVADAAVNEGNALRAEVEQQRSSLINQLQAGGDPDLAASEAIRSTQNLGRPTGFAPIGSFFRDWSSMYLDNMVTKAQNTGRQPNIWPVLGRSSAGATAGGN